ncbi:hypothetical protein [Arthrobacter sp. QXT-31]|uniref:hypothetical protein n=1 Tax=Arthrobacter sp. QXT-31 TaxID=1357915 RepID=UPI0009718B21|nr:hypothetical protein [Arthrobacter sp. QXT-31]APX03887.1 hypothetical protein BWQ92_21135 [Arthrobacter sp. QXT-31]
MHQAQALEPYSRGDQWPDSFAEAPRTADIASTAALSRGWNYTRYVARMAQDLRTKHTEPAGA